MAIQPSACRTLSGAYLEPGQPSVAAPSKGTPQRSKLRVAAGVNCRPSTRIEADPPGLDADEIAVARVAAAAPLVEVAIGRVLPEIAARERADELYPSGFGQALYGGVAGHHRRPVRRLRGGYREGCAAVGPKAPALELIRSAGDQDLAIPVLVPDSNDVRVAVQTGETQVAEDRLIKELFGARVDFSHALYGRPFSRRSPGGTAGNPAEACGGQVVRMRPGRRLGVPAKPVGFVGWGTPEHAH